MERGGGVIGDPRYLYLIKLLQAGEIQSNAPTSCERLTILEQASQHVLG